MFGFDVLDYTWLIPAFPFLAFLAILLLGKQDYPTFKGGERGGAIAAMGIGLAVMIILWGIGKKRGHKKLSDDDS